MSLPKPGFVVGLVAGAIAGAVFSVLVAPRSGEETREDVADAAGAVTSAAVSAPKTIRDQVTAVVQSQVDRFQDALAASREAAALTEQEMLEEYERTLDEARRRR